MDPSESVYEPPSPSSRVKSGARGRSEAGAVVAVASGVSVVVVASPDPSGASVAGATEDPVLSGEPVLVVEGAPSEGAQATAMSATTAKTVRRRRTRETVEQHRYMRCKYGLSRESRHLLYNPFPVSETTLYFAYGSFLDPVRISEAAPGSKFLFTAHFPETKLDFAHSKSDGVVPTLTKESGHTVWGGVFEIPVGSVDSLTKAEKAEGREPGFDVKAVDREGNKYNCLTFVSTIEPNGDQRPNPEYIESMIEGARHWNLPAGWVMGLEDLIEDPLFS